MAFSIIDCINNQRVMLMCLYEHMGNPRAYELAAKETCETNFCDDVRQETLILAKKGLVEITDENGTFSAELTREGCEKAEQIWIDELPDTYCDCDDDCDCGYVGL